TGLGLWVSKGIIDKHQGTVRVRSCKGVGTVFQVFLPLLPTLAGESQSESGKPGLLDANVVEAKPGSSASIPQLMSDRNPTA
ncbi:MAG TPA: ATP-binding protein, partial [Terriglobales bacterium]